MRKRLGTAIAALIIIVLALIAIFHNGAARFALVHVAGIATGYSIGVGDLRLGAHHGALVDVHVSRGGDPVLDARRIDLSYNLRDLFAGSKHRFGLLGITIDRPRITLVHHEDGSYNVAIPSAVSGGTRGPSAANSVPLALTIRVRDASATLVDEYRFYKESRLQRVDGINADVTIDTLKRTSYLATGRLEDNGPQPFRLAGAIDYVRGYALHHVTVRAIPIATVANYFINSPAARVLAGTVRDLDLHAWAFDVSPNAPAAYHIAGRGYLSGGQLFVRSLNSPIKDLTGAITLFDSGFAARRLTADVGGIPIVCAGGIFDFSSPQFRLGIEGHGDLRNLKEVLHVAAGLPIYGGVQLHALIEGSIADPVLLIGFSGNRFNYGAVPLDEASGAVALYHGNLIVLPFNATYSGIGLHLRGNLQLKQRVRSLLLLHAVGSSSRIPYLGALVPNQPILTEALLRGEDLKIDGRGYLLSLQNAQNVSGFYNLNPAGVGTFGPIALRVRGGGSLIAGFSLDRPNGGSAFWASARDMHLTQLMPAGLPGVNIPQLPAIDAHISDANIAGTGSGRNVVIGGTVHLAPATIAGVPFDTISASFAGPFAASKIDAVHADGPWGTFDGNGTFGTSVIAARGSYAGTLQGLRMFLGNFPAHGAISGPMGIAIVQGKIYVQAQNAQLTDANIHGIPISSVSGTMSFDRGVLRVYSAQARAAGGTVLAAGTFATAPGLSGTRMALASTQLDARTLREFGMPVSSGTLRAVGAIAPGTALPNLDAGVMLQDARAAGYGPFAASAEVSIANDALRVADATASAGNAAASIDGTIGNLTGTPAFDLRAVLPAGDVASLAALAHMPDYGAQGSVEGDVRISGTAANPHVLGSIAVPAGEFNGLGFRDASARVSAGRNGVSVSDAAVTVGSTRVHFSATLTKDEMAFAMRSKHADLSDFNDYFNTGDTLAGTGSLALAFSHFDHFTYSAGDIDISGLRYRRLPIGDTTADWTGLRNIVRGTLTVGGEHGRVRAAGTIAFAQSQQLAAVIAHSRYDIHGTLSDLDLTTWLPALGYPQLPLTGRVNAAMQVRGSYPHLALQGSASVRDGTIGPLPIETAEVTAQSAPDDRISISHLAFALPALNATGSGSFGLDAQAPLSLELHATTHDLPRLIAQLSKKRIDLSGRIETTISIGGTIKAPTFAAGVDATGVNAYGVVIPSFVGQLQLHRRDLVVRNAEITFAHGNATLAGALPLQLQPFAFGPLGSPVAMDMTADNVDLAAFAPLMGNGTKLAGVLSGHIGVSGSVGNPRIFGQLAVANASYASDLETTPITHTIAQLTFEGTHATLDRVHAQLGHGTLDGSGSLNFGGGLNGGPLAYAIALVTRKAQISLPQYGSGTFDSALSLQRTAGRLTLLKGKVALSDAVIPFGAFMKFGAAGGGAGPSGPPFNLAFDLGITAGKNVRVRGGGAGLFGLDISGQGAVQLFGTLLHPTLSGRFDSAGGTLTYIDHAFKVQQGQVTFDPANGVLPDIYAVAFTHVTNPDPNPQRNPTGYADITASVSGTVPDLKVSFTSDPAGYTDQQIIALLLPLGGLVGPIQFTDTGVILPAGQLAGAPAAGTGAALPNIFVRRQNGTVTIGQEAFNILNTQFASGILGPVESALGSSLGLSSVDLTVDYTGGLGVSLRRLLGNDLYALYGTTFTVPVRQTFGFAYQPNAFTSAQFTMFVQQGETPLFLAPNQTLSTNPRASAGQALQGRNGFTFLFQRLF